VKERGEEGREGGLRELWWRMEEDPGWGVATTQG
jgi:hypothetical protein